MNKKKKKETYFEFIERWKKEMKENEKLYGSKVVLFTRVRLVELTKGL